MRQFVGIVLVKVDGSILSQHRDNKPTILGPDTWCVVGGARDEGDKDLRDTAARELREETDYVVETKELEQLAEDTYVTEKGTPVERFIFWGRYDGVQPIKTHEGQEIRFVSPTEFGSLKFYTGHEGFLRMASEKAFGRDIERK